MPPVGSQTTHFIHLPLGVCGVVNVQVNWLFEYKAIVEDVIVFKKVGVGLQNDFIYIPSRMDVGQNVNIPWYISGLHRKETAWIGKFNIVVA